METIQRPHRTQLTWWTLSKLLRLRQNQMTTSRLPILVLTQPARKWAERYYNLRQWTEMPSGGHFAPMEEPVALVEDLRRFFRTRRGS